MKSFFSNCGWVVLTFAIFGLTLHAGAQAGLTQLSQDTFTDSASQHDTEVEPSVFSFGSTIVSAFQVARIYGGGGADIGFATSTDGGTTWTNGYLPGITIYKNGKFQAASDASVAYDAKHAVWLISSLPIGNNNNTVAVSSSKDGINWNKPVVLNKSPDADKNWIVCDNTSTSPFYGNCYQEWDDPSQGDLLLMSVSSDGGATWGPALTTAATDFGIGGYPLVQPNGTVIVPFLGFNGDMQAFSSTDGGASWKAAVNIAPYNIHGESGGIRSADLPSAAIAADGTVWVAWSDCRFRANCAENDIVYSTSKNGTKWKKPKRVPIDATSSTVDHFITGLGIQPGTSKAKTHVGLAYYYYPVSNCGTCQLYVGFIQSSSNGKTWSAAQTLGGPMDLSWLPQTFSGNMVADYIGVGFGNSGKAYPVFALASAPVGGLLQEAMYTSSTGLAPVGPEMETLSSEGDMPYPNAHSDYNPLQYLDQEHRYPAGGQQPPDND